MLPIINPSSGRDFKIRNFEEDKAATLKANPGLRYEGKVDRIHIFRGSYYLTNPSGELIESFGITILVSDRYPNAFPATRSTDGKIQRMDDFHIDDAGMICVEHTYIENKLAQDGLRIFDYINYYLPKYFSWVLLKQQNIIRYLQEWDHQEHGTIQVYESLLNTTDKLKIRTFLEGYLNETRKGRNDPCCCGSGKKIKRCHYLEIDFLKSTSYSKIKKDLLLFSSNTS